AKKRQLLYSRNVHFSDGVISKLYQVRENSAFICLKFSLILPAVLWYSYRKVSRKAEQRHRENMDRDAPENTKLHFNMITESWK
ncbi:hypothetical protein OSTOST_16681, partial [Ostertagia ostertagi]